MKIFNYEIVKEKLKHIKLTPHATTKNDKVGLFVNSFSDKYKQLYQQFDEFKIEDHKITIPQQDKVFFETVITNKTYSNYITTSHGLFDYVSQQLSFTWKVTTKESDDIFNTISDNIECRNLVFKYPPCLSLRLDARMQEKPIRELLELSRTLIKDEKVYIQFGFQPCEKDWWKTAEQSQKELPKRIKVSESSKLKLGYQGYDCCLRLIVESESKLRCEQIIQGYIFAFKQMNGDNELVDYKIKNIDKFMNKVRDRKIDVPFRFNKRFILTEKEIVDFIKLPQANLQKEFGLDSIERIETDIPKQLQTDNGILIGHSIRNGKKHEIKLPIDNKDYMNTICMIGSPRAGKDTAIANLIVEASQKGFGAFIPDVVDEKGRGMSDEILMHIDKSRIIDLNLSDFMNPISFSLSDVADKIGINGMNVISDNLIYVLDLGDTTKSQELCSLIARVCKCNLYDMYCILKSKEFAYQLHEKLLEEDDLLALEFKHEYLSDPKGIDTGKTALLTRLKLILGNPHFKNMFAQPYNYEIDFEKWIRENKIVILRMNKMNLGDNAVKILMYLTIMKIFWLKKIMMTDNVTHIILNEPHQFLSDSLTDLMESLLVESKKFKLYSVWAFHHSGMLPKRLWETIKSSGVNFFLFMNSNVSVYRQLEQEISPITIEMAMGTKKYESIFIPYIGGERVDPLFVNHIPPPHMRMDTLDNKNLTQLHTEKYGIRINYAREIIKNREISMYTSSSAKK